MSPSQFYRLAISQKQMPPDAPSIAGIDQQKPPAPGDILLTREPTKALGIYRGVRGKFVCLENGLSESGAFDLLFAESPVVFLNLGPLDFDRDRDTLPPSE